MVADLMSLLPASLTKNGGKDDQTPQPTPAEFSAMQTAETRVAEIVSSFGGRQSKNDDSAEIGGGSGGLVTGQEMGEGGDEIVREAMQKEANGGEGGAGVHSARQGCEDCG